MKTLETYFIINIFEMKLIGGNLIHGLAFDGLRSEELATDGPLPPVMDYDRVIVLEGGTVVEPRGRQRQKNFTSGLKSESRGEFLPFAQHYGTLE